MRCGSLVFIATLFAGCATTGNFERVLQSWVGADVDRLVAAWGPPQSSYPLRDGGQALQYSSQRSAQVGGFVYTTPQTTYETGNATVYGTNSSVRGTYSGTTTTYVQRQTPIYNVQLSCSARFTISPQGIVSAWAWQGNDCRALPSDANQQAPIDATAAGRPTEDFVPESRRGIAVGAKVQMVGEPMALYKEASRESERVRRLYKVDVLSVEEVSGDWIRVRTEDGTPGWIMRIWVGSTRSP